MIAAGDLQARRIRGRWYVTRAEVVRVFGAGVFNIHPEPSGDAADDGTAANGEG